MDNPLRYSDDVNRFFLGLMILLLPGRIITDSIVGALALPFRGESDDDSPDSRHPARTKAGRPFKNRRSTSR